jgi:glycosyltransferase involved in cell wall biosynthesis
MILSIMIPSTVSRALMLHHLMLDLNEQIRKCHAEQLVEILTDIDNGETPVGTKRNRLMERASGKYVVSIDSDDKVYDCYIEEVLNAAESDVDCFAINGIMTTNGRHEIKWWIAKDNEYGAKQGSDGKTYYVRWPNHITPIRASIAKQFKFNDVYIGEDYEWSKEIHNSGLIKTEYVIEKPLYHYVYKTINKDERDV